MHPRILELLQQELRDGFPGLAGSEVVATIPIADRIINELIASLIPEHGKVREVTIASEPGNLLSAKARLSGPSLLPSIPVTFVIDQQPEFPSRPVLGLKLSHPSKFVSMAFSTMPSMVTLPPSLTVTGDRVFINIRQLLAERGLDSWLAYVADLKVTTRASAIVLNARLTVPDT
jgi:hypothetical protein